MGDPIQSTTLSFLLCKMGQHSCGDGPGHSEQPMEPCRAWEVLSALAAVIPHPSRCHWRKLAQSCVPAPSPLPAPLPHGPSSPLQLSRGPWRARGAGLLCQPIGSFRLKNYILLISLKKKTNNHFWVIRKYLGQNRNMCMRTSESTLSSS